MRRLRIALVMNIALATTLLAIGEGPSAPLSPEVSYAAQADRQPVVLFSGLQLPDHVRYSVTLVRPLDLALSNVHVDVTVPADATIVAELETPGRTIFVGRQGNTLSWVAPSFSAGEAADAFSVRLASPLTAEARVRVSWDGDGPGAAEIGALPTLVAATAAQGSLALGTEGTNGAVMLVGDTGIQVSVAAGVLANGTELRFGRPGPDANPPAGVGSPWWCAMLSVQGLPEGASLYVLTPARQPLPPGIKVDLFAERNGAWETLDQQGVATSDGQFVAFLHPGGMIAAGTSPKTATISVSILPPAPRLAVTISGSISVRSFDSTRHTILVKNTGNAPASRVHIVIQEINLPLDFHSVTSSSTEGDCAVTQPLGLLTATAKCEVATLPAAGVTNITLDGGTTATFGSHTGSISVTAQDNFGVGNPSTQASGSYAVTLNP